MAIRYDREIVYIDLKEMKEFIPFHFDTFGFHPIVLSRLFLDVLLDREVNQVLYLDCDTIMMARWKNWKKSISVKIMLLWFRNYTCLLQTKN